MARDGQIGLAMRLRGQRETTQGLQKTEQAVGKVGTAAEESGKKTESSFKRISASLDAGGRKAVRVGGIMTGALTAPIVGAGAAILKFGGDFEAAMTESVAIMGDVSTEMRDKMETAARQVALTTKFSAEQAAESYFFLASAGLDAAQSIEALPAVASFAQAGAFDMALATDLLTDAQSALGLAAEDAQENLLNMERVSDVLVGANTLANASVQQFSEALTNRLGASLNMLGKDVEEGVAWLSVFADQGVKGATAGEQLAIVLRNMQSAQRGNAEAWEEVGLALFDSAGNMRHTTDVIADLEGHLAGLGDEQRGAELAALGFNDRAMASLLLMMGNSDAAREYEGSLRDLGGVTGDIADNQMESFQAQMGLLKDRVVDAALELYELAGPIIKDTLMPMLESAIDRISGVVEWFADLDSGTQKIILGAVGLLAVLGPLVATLGMVAISIGALMSPIGLVLGGLGAIAAAFGWLAFKGHDDTHTVSDSTEAMAARMGADLSGAEGSVGGFQDTVSTMADGVKGFVDEKVIPAFNAIKDWWDTHGEAILARVDEVVVSLGALMDTLTGKVEGVNNSFDDFSTRGETVAQVVEELIGAMGFLVGSLDTGLQAHMSFQAGVANAWNMVGNAMARTINWVIRNVFNRGLIAAFNAVTRFLAPDGRYGQIGDLSEIALIDRGQGQGYATGSRGTRTEAALRANRGGKVPGDNPAAGDVVPAWLTPREWVINAEAASSQGDKAMAALNAGRARVVGADDHLDALRADPNAVGGPGYRVGRGAPLPARLRASSTIDQLWAHFSRVAGARKTSDYRAGSTTFHGRGQAIDVVGNWAALYGAARQVWGRLAEAIGPGPMWRLGGRDRRPYRGRLWDTHVAANRHWHFAASPASWGGGGVGSFMRERVADVLERLLGPVKSAVDSRLAGRGLLGQAAAGVSLRAMDAVTDFLRGKADSIDAAGTGATASAGGPRGGVNWYGDGGRLIPDQPAVVGDRGPELWMPDRGGRIVGGDDLAGLQVGSTVVHVHEGAIRVNLPNADLDPDDVGRAVRQHVSDLAARR